MFPEALVRDVRAFVDAHPSVTIRQVLAHLGAAQHAGNWRRMGDLLRSIGMTQLSQRREGGRRERPWARQAPVLRIHGVFDPELTSPGPQP